MRQFSASLPSPARKSFASSDHDFGDYSDGEVDKRPAAKRAKQKEATMQASGKMSEISGRVDAMDSEGEKDKVTPEKPEKPDLGPTKKKPGRMESLITGPESKAVLAAENRTQPSSRKRRMRQSDIGKLARMTELPNDVFCEIATRLKPDDLLRLSRSSRALRDFLMSKSSKFIWVACRAAIGMPPCPSDLSEPQYANLYFEKECHACGYHRVEKLLDHLRIRLCKGCSNLNVFQGNVLVKENFTPEVSKNYEIYSLVPWNSMRTWDTYSLRKVDSSMQNREFLKYDFLQVVRQYLETEPNSEERRLFVEKRHQLIREIAKNVEAVGSWTANRSAQRCVTKDQMRKNRVAQIVDKLCLLGYPREEVVSMATTSPLEMRCSWHQILHQPRELNDRIWKSIQPKLEKLISQKRQIDREQAIVRNRRKRREELLGLFQESVEEHRLNRLNRLGLRYVDLCEVSIVSDLIEEDGCSVEMTRERWKPIADKLPELFESHARKVECKHARLLLQAQKEMEASETQLSDWEHDSALSRPSDLDTSIVWRASAFFRAYYPPEDLTFFDIAHLRQNYLHSTILSNELSPTTLWVDKLVYQIANAALLTLGFTEKTTMRYMMSLGKVFVCRQCDPVLRERKSWFELVHHVAQEIREYKHYKGNCEKKGVPFLDSHKIEAVDVRLAIADPEFTKSSIDSLLYANERKNGVYTKKDCGYCRRVCCFKKFLYKEQLEAHVRSRHGPDLEVL